MELLKRCRGLGLIGLAALAITPAWADLVQFSTAGSVFGNGTDLFTAANGLAITFTPTSGMVSPVPPPSSVSFGTFNVVGPTAGQDTVNTTFTLKITQTLPSAGNETLSDTFAGKIGFSSSGLNLTLTGVGSPISPVLTTNPNTGNAAYEFDLGHGIYWVDVTTAISPQSAGESSKIRGAISSIPDGGMTLMLLGSVLVGVESLRRKLRA